MNTTTGADLSLVTAHVATMRRRGLAIGTIRQRVGTGRRFAEWLHPTPLAEASTDDVHRWLDTLELIDSSRYTAISHLHRIYADAVRAGLLDRSPTDAVDRPRLRRLIPRPLSNEDVAVAIEQAPTARLKAWVTLCAFAGLRCVELARLDRTDVFLDEAMLRVVGKGRHERTVPLHPKAEAALKGYGLPRTGAVFKRPSGGPYPDGDRISKLINQHLHHVGVQGTAHQLRHWFGTRTYAQCHDLRVVQELLGHASPSTTAGYAAFSMETAAAAVGGLEAA